MALIDFFDRGWRINPNGIAYYMDGQEFTYNEIRELSCRIANALVKEGFKKETKGAVWSKNHPVSWACTLSIWRAGMAWIPVNPTSKPFENSTLLDRFDAEVVFFTETFGETVAVIKSDLPKVKKWICIDGHVDGAINLDEFIKDQDTSDPGIDHDEDGVVGIFPTGGTTGIPKGVMLTNRSLSTFCSHFLMSATYPNDIYPVNLAAAPMTHSAGVLSLPTSARGGKVVVVTKPEPKLVFDIIKKQRVTEFFLPPTVIYRLLGQLSPLKRKLAKLLKKVDFSSIHYLFYGAAPMSTDKLKEAIKFFGPVMMGGYGQTEAPLGISALRPEEHFKNGIGGKLADDLRLKSVGRVLPHNRVEILDDENNILATGETGEICVQGNILMKGYYKDIKQTDKTIVDGWLHTGDIGNLDEEGYLYITDRKKDMIISGGFNIYPQDIEQVIWGHPAVQDCAVIGIPNEDWGEAVKAVLELNPGQTVDPDEIIKLCKDKLGSVKTPKTVDIVDELPRSDNGKVLKKDLRAQYLKN